ncbi:MAG: GNAT family N-acetyltransferase [Clostridia bacterium]|nr:GNAT family N-acetyltransferase [Clostridia bacterium]
MRRLQSDKFSDVYSVRLLDETDIPMISALCRGNTQFYSYCGQPFSEETIRSDLYITPPGKGLEDKYYTGFFCDEQLCAVMDLIDGYPDDTTAFIGFFMLDKEIQGEGRGSAMITELCAYLKRMGCARVQLGIDKDNPQSTHFWKKNGFLSVREIVRPEGTIILAQRMLR